MKKLAIDYREYIQTMRWKDYAFIDPPWLHNDNRGGGNQVDYTLWEDNIAETKWLFENLKVNVILLWVTNGVFMEMAAGYLQSESNFIYKTFDTWLKLTKHGKRHWGTGNTLRNSTEQLVFFQLKGTKALHIQDRNIFDAPKSEERTVKPKDKELFFMDQLWSRGYKKGCYLFSGPEVKLFEGWPIDCVDICFKEI